MQEAIGFVERHGATSLVLFFWFKVVGSILSFAGEYIFQFQKKQIFLLNIGHSPTKMLRAIYLADFTFYLLLCVLIVVYI